ncbi:MAG: hypothetical protein MUF15_07760 [Acidobacteria bacterium]|jgi:predicted PurR-regulated permease PerM|nr:hypothetical protein [Acidobacteriota bacterium]
MRKKIQMSVSTAVLLFGVLFFTPGLFSQTGFTQQDREDLIEIKATMKAMDQRISELREDMNKRFEQVDKRIEQVDKRIDQMMSFVWILATIFAGMFAVTIGFALWDRRTMIRPFEIRVAQLDARADKNDIKYANLIEVIKGYAATDKKLAALVERFNIL